MDCLDEELDTFEEKEQESVLPRPSKRKINGRPNRFWNESTRDKILDYLEEGANLSQACDLAGVTRRLVQHWKAVGIAEWESWEDGRLEEPSDYALFAMDIAYCIAKFNHEWGKELKELVKKSPSAWAAYMTYRERTAPEEWGQKQNQAPEVKVTYEVVILDGEDFLTRNMPGSRDPNLIPDSGTGVPLLEELKP